MLMVYVIVEAQPPAKNASDTAPITALTNGTVSVPLVSATAGPTTPASIGAGELAQYEAQVAELKALYNQARKECMRGEIVLG